MLYGERRSVLLETLHRELGLAVNVTGEQAGLHLALSLPTGFKDRQLAERAAQNKLWLVPLSASYLERPSPQGFILGFGSTPTEEIPRAVRKLRGILQSI